MLKNYVASMETHLGRAFLTMVLAVLLGVASMLALDNFGYNSGLSFLFIFAAMPFFAWFISRAAKELGKKTRCFMECSRYFRHLRFCASCGFSKKIFVEE